MCTVWPAAVRSRQVDHSTTDLVCGACRGLAALLYQDGMKGPGSMSFKAASYWSGHLKRLMRAHPEEAHLRVASLASSSSKTVVAVNKTHLPGWLCILIFKSNHNMTRASNKCPRQFCVSVDSRADWLEHNNSANKSCVYMTAVEKDADQPSVT